MTGTVPDPAASGPPTGAELAAELPAITEITRLTVHPGDKLIIRLDTRHPTQMELNQAEAVVRQRLNLPPEVDVLAVGAAADLGVLRLFGKD